jgi:hypothetical protein
MGHKLTIKNKIRVIYQLAKAWLMQMKPFSKLPKNRIYRVIFPFKIRLMTQEDKI